MALLAGKESMTAVLGINFHYQVLVIADCRVTWTSGRIRLQDNLQKIYPFGPTGVIAFAGPVGSSRAVLQRIRSEALKKSLPPSVKDIVGDMSVWAREAYATLATRDKKPLELMYAAVDYSRVTLSTANLTFADNILVKMASPGFEPVRHPDVVRLGSAIKYPEDALRGIRDDLVGYATQPGGLQFQAGIAIGAVGDALRTLAEGSTVGGLFSVGIISVRGVFWYSYGIGEAVELRIEDGQFIQYDHRNRRRVPLKTVWEFDPAKPDAGDLVFQPPEN